jgi:opacity protein-like surface antigen
MKKLTFLIIFLIIGIKSNSQFEQKVSISLSSGFIKTYGDKYYKEDAPYQMPNYRAGVTTNAGVQFNLSRRFSLLADLGLIHSSKWSYIYPNGADAAHFDIWDSITGNTLLAEGYNELNFTNYSVGVQVKCYLLPGKRWNPYVYIGPNLNYSSAKYTDNFYKALVRIDYLHGNYETYNLFLEKNFGFGFTSGIGLEFCPNDKLGFYLSAGHYLILMNKDQFPYPKRKENYKAYMVQAGIRFSFLKSKKL